MAKIGTDLTQGSVPQKLIRFSIPFFFSNLLQALYGIFDTLVVAHFSGQVSITGVTQGSQIMNVITFLVIGLSEGAAVMVSQYLVYALDSDGHQSTGRSAPRSGQVFKNMRFGHRFYLHL